MQPLITKDHFITNKVRADGDNTDEIWVHFICF